MAARWMIYGATGYTGQLLGHEAKQAGQAPLLSGRSAEKLRKLGDTLGFEHHAVALDDRRGLRDALAGIDAVVHCAGPFSKTSRPMLEACLDTGTHYLDITGEIDVFEAAAARGDQARKRKLVVMPGVGFDVVPSDCLLAHVHQRLGDTTSLAIGIEGLGGASRGTAKSSVESVRRPSRIRRGGTITDAPRTLVREFDYGNGPKKSLSVSWGDVSTAYHSTGVRDVTVYFAATRQLEKVAAMGPVTRWFLGTPLMQAMIKRKIDQRPEGPTDDQRARGHATLVAVAENAGGETAAARLRTPEGYTLTARTALEIATRVLRGEVEPGFQTPSSAFGADFITEFPDCRREDL